MPSHYHHLPTCRCLTPRLTIIVDELTLRWITGRLGSVSDTLRTKRIQPAKKNTLNLRLSFSYYTS